MSHNVTFEFPTEEMSGQFMAWFDDQGEQDYAYCNDDIYFMYNYTNHIITAGMKKKQAENNMKEL